MAYRCIYGRKDECDGCMECKESPKEMEEDNIPDYVYEEKSWKGENDSDF